MTSDEPKAAAWLYESNYDGRKQVWPEPFPNEMSDRHPEASPLYTASDLASARAQGRREGTRSAAAKWHEIEQDRYEKLAKSYHADRNERAAMSALATATSHKIAAKHFRALTEEPSLSPSTGATYG